MTGLATLDMSTLNHQMRGAGLWTLRRLVQRGARAAAAGLHCGSGVRYAGYCCACCGRGDVANDKLRSLKLSDHPQVVTQFFQFPLARSAMERGADDG
eukprot:CAMPEP_0206045464 /NCGR_PEP_ID=MMETSP1466-20131121/15983_1 /ASSEMBLY_ACC=CAM_ASM_001126 /TAXON_ID=44452 /ORGANISM="Pavlova gyrans, Strain CCMP608" /LENGTH=97 /DNA_ID=CAMNT_0053420403 /DNA_START=379 /DNA_END=670 /DNA_ORIENTATION=-